MAVEELADHVSPKSEGDPSVIFPPALYILVWVGPQQIAQQAWNRKLGSQWLIILLSSTNKSTSAAAPH